MYLSYTHRALLRQLRKAGRPATGEVLHIRTHWKAAQLRSFLPHDDDDLTVGWWSYCRLTLQVKPADGAPFEVRVRTKLWDTKVPGATVPVLYDPRDHRKVVVDYQLDAQKRRTRAARPRSDGDALYDRYKKRMKELEDQRDRGLITQEQVNAEETKMLGDLPK